MRWLYDLFWIAVVLGFIGIVLKDVFPVFILFAMAFWGVMGFSVRCPRCSKHVLDNGRGYQAPWIEIPERCVGCGRHKDDIWPFQWLFRPERQ